MSSRWLALLGASISAFTFAGCPLGHRVPGDAELRVDSSRLDVADVSSRDALADSQTPMDDALNDSAPDASIDVSMDAGQDVVDVFDAQLDADAGIDARPDVPGDDGAPLDTGVRDVPGDDGAPRDAGTMDAPSDDGVPGDAGMPACGGAGQPCCAGGGLECTGGGVCVGGTCRRDCGAAGQSCCSSDACATGLACLDPDGSGILLGRYCMYCGQLGEPCCPSSSDPCPGGGTCQSTGATLHFCVGGTARDRELGGRCSFAMQNCRDGYRCLKDNTDLLSDNGHCIQCGVPGRPCCRDGTSLVCRTGSCEPPGATSDSVCTP